MDPDDMRGQTYRNGGEIFMPFAAHMNLTVNEEVTFDTKLQFFKIIWKLLYVTRGLY